MKSRQNGRAWETIALACCLALLSGCVANAAAAQRSPAAHNENTRDSAEPETSTLKSSTNTDTASSAICQIVYQVDEGVPSPHGYRYIFYGNGFFINKDGYLLTAAHVLSQLAGGEPFLLLHDNAGQVQFVRAAVVALDSDHDVAVLHAVKNPFAGKYDVSFLPLDSADAKPGEMVRAESFSPSQPRDAFSLDPIRELLSPGQVLRFEFSELDKGAAETELFLFNHNIEPGQSGSPVISKESHGVAGLVEGQWLRDSSAVFAELSVREMGNGAPSAKGVASVPGAVVPIHYALPLLQRNGITWQSATHGDDTNAAEGDTRNLSLDGPTPLSLVAAPYPPSLFGGEVLLDAAIDRNGTLSDVKVLHGDQPFLRQALDAVRTWTFVPQTQSDRADEARIAIAFQFPQPYAPPRRPTVHHFNGETTATAVKISTRSDMPDDSPASVITSYEPNYPTASNVAGSVILYESIDGEGHVRDVHTLSGTEPLLSKAIAAAKEWQFSPATHDGHATDSEAILVITFRQPLNGAPASPRCAMQMCGEKACLACNTPADSTETTN
ncbi:MAG TPA: TonB family protein [Candidatus Acidoferrales bacterium]|nr:TonB family protein [Candidatus Acidoferrales bacterium]